MKCNKLTNGVWSGRFSYTDPRTGKRHWVRVTKPTEALCNKALITGRAAAYEDPSERARKQTLREYLAIWLPNKLPELRHRSAISYTNSLKLVDTHLGSIRLDRLHLSDANAMITELMKTHKPATIQTARMVLNIVMNDLVRHGVLPSNPLRGSTRPRSDEAPVKAWTREEAQRFRQFADEDRWAAFWQLALARGIRLGELLGLKWSDVDLEGKTVRIQRTRHAEGAEIILGPPKTRSSRRTIPLTETCVLRLLRWRAEYPGDPTGNDLIFSDELGPWTKGRVYRAFNALIDASGNTPIVFHGLRHTTASLLLQAGTHPKVVQELLGHATITITLDTYSHLIPAMSTEAADTMELILRADSEQKASETEPIEAEKGGA